jgi:CPA1 family monovalent cation:H+ antiporter
MGSINILDTAAILVVLAAFFSFINHVFLRLPDSIGLMVSGLAASIGLLALDALLPALEVGEGLRAAIQGIDFPELLMHGMLGFLLFAGALHTNLADLLAKKGPILSLASAGVMISTAVIGLGSYWLFQLAEAPVPFAYCLVFGALISPTDPIAVLGIMKKCGAPKSLEIKVAGESLFNDGVGVVAFTALVAFATRGAGGTEVGAGEVVRLFLQEVVGGVGLGLVAGFLVYKAMKRIEEPNLEVLLSFALVMGMTFLAFRIHLSAPLACVVAGLFIGNHGRSFAMSERTSEALDLVWSFTDQTLNAILFLFLGLEVVALSFQASHLAALALLVPLVLAGRFTSVFIPVLVLSRLRHEFSRGAVQVLTWGGLRGGISMALALSLPAFEGREAVLTATYGIVAFSVLVQGLTIGSLIARVAPREGR